MKTEDILACEILRSMDIAILRRISPRFYKIFGTPPDFYMEMFCDETGQPNNQPWNVSPMLDFFLDDAEHFFEQKNTGKLTSAMWQEDGKTSPDTALMSVAATYAENQVILIYLLEKEFQNHAGILSKARKQLLKNRTLSSDLEYFKKKSRIDDLTKIFNKATFMDLLKDEIKRSVLLDYSLALLIIDIDNFKKINDTYGHLVGDKVLETLGQILHDSLRQNDIVGRFGGEEFTALVPQVDEEQALAIASKLRQKITQSEFPGIRGITVSIGCSLYTPSETLESFIDRADIALYSAKTNGKNRVCSG